MKFVITGAVVIFIVFYIMTSPDQAAHIVHNSWHGAVHVAHGIGGFVDKRRPDRRAAVPAFLPAELPIQARARHHWFVLFRRPHPVLAVALLILFVAAVLDPSPMAWPFLLVLTAAAYLRWKTWTTEMVVVTRRRIVRTRGIPETTTTEASLRLDRISGVVLEQTVFGKMFNYGTIELEAPGQHPDLRRIEKLARPRRIYFLIRQIVYGEMGSDRLLPIAEVTTAPLPVLPPWGSRHRR